MSKVISPIMTDGTGMAIAQAINHATAVNLALNTASYEEDGTLLEVQDARTVNETQYASLGEAIRTEVTRIDNEKEVQGEALEGHADRITAVENKANTNATNISNLTDRLNNLRNDSYRLKTYDSLSRIGLTLDTVTDLSTIVKAMPTSSILEFAIYSEISNDFFSKGILPEKKNGIMRIAKIDRVNVQFISDDNCLYIKTAANGNSDITSYMKWKKYSGEAIE